MKVIFCPYLSELKECPCEYEIKCKQRMTYTVGIVAKQQLKLNEKEEKREMKTMRRRYEDRFVVMCDECGKRLKKPYLVPHNFILICHKCYEDFKHRRQPNQMHYKRNISSSKVAEEK